MFSRGPSESGPRRPVREGRGPGEEGAGAGGRDHMPARNPG